MIDHAEHTERDHPEESAPNPARSLGEYLCLESVDFGTAIEVGLAVYEEGTWRLLDKLPGEQPACGTITRGGNGNTYFTAYAPWLGRYARNDPVQIKTKPYRLNGYWVQYMGAPITEWPDGKSTAAASDSYKPRPPKRYVQSL